MQFGKWRGAYKYPFVSQHLSRLKVICYFTIRVSHGHNSVNKWFAVFHVFVPVMLAALPFDLRNIVYIHRDLIAAMWISLCIVDSVANCTVNVATDTVLLYSFCYTLLRGYN
jgi:hypothetical protein